MNKNYRFIEDKDKLFALAILIGNGPFEGGL
jgi:hypothetical protein